MCVYLYVCNNCPFWTDFRCPVFRPTWDEFTNFSKYIQHLEKDEGVHRRAGICKIIPPECWFVREDAYDLNDELGSIIVNPDRQFISGKKGAHTININKERKSMSVLEFFNHCSKHSFESENESRGTAAREDSWIEREKQLWNAVGRKSGHDDTKSPLAIYGNLMFNLMFTIASNLFL